MARSNLKGRIDTNQPEIIKCFEKLGMSVAATSDLGDGFPDIVVAFGKVTVLVEIKDGAKPPSKRKLTTDEQVFKNRWQGWYEIVESTPQAVKLAQKIRKVASFLAQAQLGIM